MDYYGAKDALREACEGFTRATSKQLGSFRSVFGNSSNLVTQDIFAFLSLEGGKYIAEISFGSGFQAGTYIFGCTIIERRGAGLWQRSKMSQCFTSTQALRGFLTEMDEPCED